VLSRGGGAACLTQPKAVGATVADGRLPVCQTIKTSKVKQCHYRAAHGALPTGLQLPGQEHSSTGCYTNLVCY